MASSREVPNQIINGTVMSERDCLLHFVEHMGQARASLNGLAQLRKDMRYLALCGIIDEIREKATLLANKPAGIVIPKSFRN